MLPPSCFLCFWPSNTQKNAPQPGGNGWNLTRCMRHHCSYTNDFGLGKVCVALEAEEPSPPFGGRAPSSANQWTPHLSPKISHPKTNRFVGGVWIFFLNKIFLLTSKLGLGLFILRHFFVNLYENQKKTPHGTKLTTTFSTH